ncbi:telomere length regulation protein TEL2 homolog [Dendroctonus ponderosae]|uniref:telomere length regulation protein TEL2 homolog n=1 Tax=Dendroctonus ponderosae TaxID=77166 RepID=UPI002035CE35|nr:telomere length regulation protein TEL2 homolog [Dendroctonus ponderosae]XP_048522970.1 telomere length regulation protein TEL2 homolog [Dendroctonus ponderosae]
MESLFSMWKVREIADKVTNVVMNYTEIEAKVREATNDEAWGPTGALMQELAHATFTYEHFPEVLSMLWKRMLQDSKQHWRRTYKSLLVLNYLIKNGSERVVTSAREHIYDLRSLENYTFIDENGKDQGVNIRHKVKELIDFVQDDDRLREERKKAKKNKDKYIGMSSDMMGMKFGSGAEKWDEKPYTKNDFGDNNWDDHSNGRYRDKSYDEDIDREAIDSDDDRSSRGGTSSANRYKDEGGPGSPPASTPTYPEKKVNLVLNSTITASPKKTQKTLKKVDLGAAANFGRDATQSPLPRPPSGGASDLFDDFDPRASEKIVRATDNEFGDFEVVFNNPPPVQTSSVAASKPEDDFADFSSAFSTSSSTAPSSLLTSPTTPTVLPNIISPTMGVSNSLLSMGPNLLGGLDQPTLGGQTSLLGPTPAQPAPVVAPKDDLLGDFSSMSIQPQIVSNNLNNNFNDGFLGGPALLDNFNDGKSSQPRLLRHKKTRLQKDLEQVTIPVIDHLIKVKKIASQSDIDLIMEQLNSVLNHYPATVNIYKLQGLDDISYDEYVDKWFAVLLEELVRLFDHSFPFKDGKIYQVVGKLFSIPDSSFFEASLEVLVKSLKGKTSAKSAVGCLQVLLQAEGLFACIVSSSFSPKDHWEHIVKLIVSLPARVANCLERETPDFFSNQQFANLLLYNFLKSFEFAALIVHAESKLQNRVIFTNVAHLLSQIIVNFNERNNCNGLDQFVFILGLITSTKSEKTGCYQSLLYGILNCLYRPAVEILAKTCLTKLDPKAVSMKSLLGKELLKNPDWKYVLCTKLPLLSFIEKDHENFVTNLVSYLGSVSHSELVRLFSNLVVIWSSKSSLNRTSVEHHVLISKFIVCIVNCLKQIGLSEFERNTIKESVYRGLPIHLESTVDAISNSGKKTGEIVVNFLNEETDLANPLKFEYDRLSKETLEFIKQLEYFQSLDFEEVYRAKNSSFDVDAELLKLSKSESPIEYVPPHRVFRSHPEKIQSNEIVISHYVKPTERTINIIDNNLELDSDDEFEPYDLSNDDTGSEKPPPAYLRDVIENLLETDDPVVFDITLQHCESLVKQQLPDDDASIGLELLQILITLDCKFYMENFNMLVFQSCVAITCVYPAAYAEYLCKEVHAEIGKYSVVHRILMLDILRQASKSLSSFSSENTQNGNSKHAIASDVVRKRLESKTRYFHQSKVIPKAEQINRFAEVAGYFFFPLIYGYNQNVLLTQPITKNSDDYLLLVHFVETLAIIMFCAQNCNISIRMAKEALQFSWFLRFHKDVKVRMAVFNLIGAILLTVPQALLIQNFVSELLELHLWLVELLNPNVNRGEPNDECRRLISSTVFLLQNVLKVDLEEADECS